MTKANSRVDNLLHHTFRKALFAQYQENHLPKVALTPFVSQQV